MKYPVYDSIESARCGVIIGATRTIHDAKKILAAHYSGTSWDKPPTPVLREFDLFGRTLIGWVDAPE